MTPDQRTPAADSASPAGESTVIRVPGQLQQALIEAGHALPGWDTEGPFLSSPTIARYQARLASAPLLDETISGVLRSLSQTPGGYAVVRLGNVADELGAGERFLLVATAILASVARPFQPFRRWPLWKEIGTNLDADPGLSTGTGYNPFHIDLVNATRPPDYTVLLCVRPDPLGGGARLLSDARSAASRLTPPSRALRCSASPARLVPYLTGLAAQSRVGTADLSHGNRIEGIVVYGSGALQAEMRSLMSGRRKAGGTRPGRSARACLMAAVMVAGLAGAVVAEPALAATAKATRTTLPDPVPTWTQYFTDAGPAGSAVTIPVRVWLAGRAPAAENRFAAGASTPGSNAYGKYLTPAQFTARFGSTAAQVAAVEAWARSAGLTVGAATSHYVALSGTAPRLSAALRTCIHAYTRSPGGPVAGYAPVSGISVPASIGADVLTVTGLDDDSYSAGPAGSAAHRVATPDITAAPESSPWASFACSHWWGQHVSAIPKADGRTSAPDAVCGYTPQQLRSAYGVSAGSGKGATIAIVLDGSLATMAADANRFFRGYHLAGYAPGQFTVNTGPGFAASCDGSSDLPEEPLDVETAHIIAPAAKVVYVAANCTGDQQQDLLDAETRIVDQHLADVSTESFSIVENGDFTPATAAAWTAVFEQGAAEGIGFNFDSGDGGDSQGAGVTFPASDPWATAVGGTTLEIGRYGAVTGELGWGDNGAEENAAGTGYQQPPPGAFEEGSTGGRSLLFPQPAYQRGVVPAILSTDGGTLPADREVPDVAADASPMTGWTIGYTTPGAGYGTQLEGGTSGSSPIVASLEADAKQAAGHAIGFANPLLYDLRATAAIRDITASPSPALTLAPDCYNDQITPNPACLVTLGPDSSLTERPGYDDVTGIGAVTSRFIAALAKG